MDRPEEYHSVNKIKPHALAKHLPRTIRSGHFKIGTATIKVLEAKHGQEKLRSFLQEYNAAGRIEALTEKEGRVILRQSSLNSLRDKILAAAREANISPDAWEVRRSVLMIVAVVHSLSTSRQETAVIHKQPQ